MKFSLKTNAKHFIKKEIKTFENAINKASISATNKVARQALTDGKKAIKRTYLIKPSVLNSSTKVYKATYNYPAARIIAFGKPLSFSYHGAIQQKKTGVSIMVRKGARKIMRGGFKATMPKTNDYQTTQHVGVFYRTNKSKRKYKLGGAGYINIYARGASPTMLPIVERKGPSAVNLIQSKAARNAIDNYVKQNHGRIYSHELNYYSKSAGRR